MENKTINATDFGPEIQMEAQGKIRIHGKAMMEDASLYFSPCHHWISEFISKNNSFLLFEIELNYFNSSAAKQLLKMLMIVDDSEIEGKVIWMYPKENDVLLERGQELEIMLDFPFEFQAM